MDNSYIKLYRMLIKKPIWLNSTPEHKSILITLLLLANHKKADWEWMGEKFSVNPGQFVTSLESIRKKTGKGISIQNIRSCLKRLTKLHFATNKATKAGRLITIINWGSYQPKKNKATKIPTNEQQSSNKGATPNKNDKNNKKDIYRRVISYLNRKTGRKYSPAAKETISLIDKRISEGYKQEDFKIVIDNQYRLWSNDTEMNEYLRPTTLFGNKFDIYLNNIPINGTQTKEEMLKEMGL